MDMQANQGRRLPVWAAIILLLASATGFAAEDRRLPVTPATTQQKAKFVGSLVTDSAASRNIESSGDQAAQKALAEARKLVGQATERVAAGDYEASDRILNEALDLVMQHSRRLSERAVRAGGAQKIYEARLATVTALLDAFKRVAEEKSQAGYAREKAAMIRTSLAEAEASALAGRYDNALAITEQAYNAVAAEVAAMRDGEKLVKTLKFDAPADEYVYEVDRNDSHFYLLKITLAEKSPHPMYVSQIDGMRAQAQDLRSKAEEAAREGQFPEAIRLLGDSTGQLIRALRMAGAYIPG